MSIPDPEPTLDQIADGDVRACIAPSHALVIARELRALRAEMRAEHGVLHERIHTEREEAKTDVYLLAGTVERIADQLDALEAPRSQGDAAGDTPKSWPEWVKLHGELVRELDETNSTVHRERCKLSLAVDARDEARAERDAARALRPYAKHHDDCAYSLSTGDCTCGLAAITAALDTGAS